MGIAEELERLAKLRADGALTVDEFARAKSQLLSGPAVARFPFKGVRRQSSRKIFGLPLWAIAVGPDWERREMRGHARAIFALGDIATGWFACGGFARGIVAIGGLALGLFAFGGGAIGLLVAVGGGAIGTFAFGGGACGYYAIGGGAVGAHTVSALHQDPELVDFLQKHFPWVMRSFGR